MVVDKIMTLERLIKLIATLKKKGKKIVYAHGAFDLLHAGHIHHLVQAKKLGDILIVTVTPDKFIKKGPGRPRFNEAERLKFVAGLECVDFVGLNSTHDASHAIKMLSPDIYVKGKDVIFKSDKPEEGLYREIEALKLCGGKINFIESLPIHSTELLNEYFSIYPKETNEFLDIFSKKYPPGLISSYCDKIKKMKILVIGDAIIDQYQYVALMTKSPKSNHLVAKYLNEEEFAGGVMACANHVAGFCDNIVLVTCLGALDPKEKFIKQHLNDNIAPHFLYRPDTPTTIKKRFVEPAYLTKFFEINSLNESDLPKKLNDEMYRFLENEIGRFDLVMVADYGHGLLADNVIHLLSTKAKKLAINVQTNSANYGYNLVTKYPRADYICIDEAELRLSAHNRAGELGSLIKETSRKMKTDRISITRGHKGCMTFAKSEGFKEIPVFSTNIVDTVGAGDAFFAVSSPWTTLGVPMELVGFVGNIAGAIKVGTLCNKSAVGSEQLKEFVERLLVGRNCG